MMRLLFGNKIATMITVAVIVLAVWKYNNGDVTGVIDGIWNALNKAADSLIQVWDHFFGDKPPAKN